MKRWLLCLILLSGCAPQHPGLSYPGPGQVNPNASLPPADLPAAVRAHNYAGGSCYHAAFADSLTGQDQIALAAWWRKHHRGGEYTTGLVADAKNAGVQVAWTVTGDPAFLDWCSRTRRPAAITYFSSHAVTFNGWLHGQAVLTDNNQPAQYRLIPRSHFLAAWKGYGGDAVAAVYVPSIPKPW